MFHNFVMIFAAITAVIVGAEKIKWSSHPVWLCLSVANYISDIISHVIISYKFPLLFISWIIIQDPLVQKIAKILYTKIKEKQLSNKKQIN